MATKPQCSQKPCQMQRERHREASSSHLNKQSLSFSDLDCFPFIRGRMAARSLGWQTFPEKSTYDLVKYGVGIGEA